MAYTPERGDIIHLQFDPASGHEMRGPHYALVVTAKIFNERGLAMCCPVSQGAADVARSRGTLVSLTGSGLDIQGSVHCHQLKSLDWRARKANLKEKAPAFVVEDVMARLETILFG